MNDADLRKISRELFIFLWYRAKIENLNFGTAQCRIIAIEIAEEADIPKDMLNNAEAQTQKPRKYEKDKIDTEGFRR